MHPLHRFIDQHIEHLHVVAELLLVVHTRVARILYVHTLHLRLDTFAVLVIIVAPLVSLALLLRLGERENQLVTIRSKQELAVLLEVHAVILL